MVSSFEIDKHVKYIKRNMMALPAPYATALPNHLSVIYFMVSGLDILDRLNELDTKQKNDIIDYIYSRQILPFKGDIKNNDHCGFRGSNYIGQPFVLLKEKAKKEGVECGDHLCQDYPIFECDQSTLANTYCALMILAILGDDYSCVNRKAIASAMTHFQQEDGSFIGVSGGGESDMRYLYTAVATCYLLGDWSGINREKAIEYIRQSKTYEYAYAQGPGQEAHGGSTYCALAALTLMGVIDQEIPPGGVERDRLLQWLATKQITGFCGRTNKEPDTCYSFWVGASLEMLNAYHLVDYSLIRSFILAAQHPAIGGIAKVPDTLPDALHTYMSFSGLSIGKEQGLLPLHCSLGITQRTWLNKFNK